MLFNIRKIILGMSVLFLSASCQFKDFDEYAGSLEVPVIADYSHAGCSVMPDATRVIFYPQTGIGQPFIYDIRDSIFASLPNGSYTVFAYNNDSEINRTRSYAYREGSPILYTDKADGRGLFKKDSLDYTVYYDYPDSTYAYYGAATVSGVPETIDSVSNRIVLRMSKVTRLVDIRVKGIKNTDYIKSVRMSLDGLHLEYSPKKVYPNTDVCIAADGRLEQNTDLTSKFAIFGASKSGHILGIHLFTGYHHKVLWCDVTNIVNNQLEGANPIKIEVRVNYDVKDDVPESKPFDVGVDDWEDITIPIDM